ncbi:MAG: peptidase S9, partial [Calditrichia bacterium]
MKTFPFSRWMVIIVMVLSSSVCAQYFGRNKVQYENFDFRVLETENFHVYYYPQEREPAVDAGRMLERWNVRFQEVFDFKLKEMQPLILYANHPDFQQTNVISGLISQGTGGVTEGMKNRIVLPLTGAYSENNHVIGHELVHAFQFDIMRRLQEKRMLVRNQHVPLWFIEGMAEYLSLGSTNALTAMWLRDAVLNDNVPDFDDLARDPRYFPYRWGHAAWNYIGSRWGDQAVGRLLKQVFQQGWDKAFQQVTGAPADSVSHQFKRDVEKAYRPQLQGRTRPGETGKPLLTGGQGMNLSPSLSPDGRYIAFLSQRDVFTIDLFLADAGSGKVIKKLVSSNTDTHFDALQFMDASGSWSPDGGRFAFVILENGDSRIALLNVSNQKIERKIALPGV